MPGLSNQGAAALAILLVLSGCKLIDQRTFAPAPEAASPAVAARSTETRTPLMTIAPGTKLATYEGLLRTAVHDAQSRDPAVSFDVVSVVPASGTLADQVKAAEADRASAMDVAQALLTAGVAEDRVALGARVDPGAHGPNVRVYVR
ncbi:MAG TPA: hypothetical protein VIJ55_00780 [Acetobacteraceae bacterium]